MISSFVQAFVYSLRMSTADDRPPVAAVCGRSSAVCGQLQKRALRWLFPLYTHISL
jgi:hypothetical protein